MTDSNSNVTMEIISKTKTKVGRLITNDQLRLLILVEAKHVSTRVIGLQWQALPGGFVQSAAGNRGCILIF